MALEMSHAAPLEIAHILFIDIVGYSKLPVDLQRGAVKQLQRVVQGCSGFVGSQQNGDLLCIPTGDGMALAFWRSPETPVRCAIEVSRALRQDGEVQVRMGIHSGPVYRISDISSKENLAGAGMNLAQRVMDCGDGGHILLSSSVAEVLQDISAWSGLVHLLGDVEVKHGARLKLYSLYSDEYGNPARPQRRFIAPVNDIVNSPPSAEDQSKEPGMVAANRSKVQVQAAKPWGWLSAVVMFLFVAVAGTFWFSQNRKTVLTEKDSVVLADFANSTGDAVFDGTLRQGLAVQLTQSPFLNLVPEQQIQRTLLLMGQAPGARLASDTARQLCQRIAAAAVVEGSITRLGSEYVLGLKAVSCQSGDPLAEEQVQAARKEDVLQALSRASAQLREKLGESLSTVKKFDTPLDQATTPSIEALLAYTLGRRKYILHSDSTGAIPLFQRAIDLDPNFAMAHLSLGLCQLNLGQRGLASDSIRKAFELREHVSQWEKFAIESRYFFAVVGDLVKARKIYRLWAQIYPREVIPLSVLAGEIDPELGRYDEALVDAREALTLGPWDPEQYEVLVVAYINLNQLENARVTADEANQKKLESIDLHWHLYHLAFLQKDEREMARQVTWSLGKEGVEDLLLSYQADTAAFTGQIEKARELSRRAVASAEQAGQKETAAGFQAESAMREALFGNFAEARILATDALALSTSPDVEARAAFALAVAGGPADRLADDLAQRFPEDTTVQYIFLPVIRAQLALNRRDPAQAIKELETSAPFELGKASPEEIFPFALYPIYVRGKAFLAANNGKQAAVEFQKILDRPALVLNEPIGILALQGLARSYVLQQQPDKARASYQEFMSVWHEADDRSPIFHEASSEYSQLGGAK
jgi:eukaryotic-like serine/threonine-protein kinase